jgi:hypothetical protein
VGITLLLHEAGLVVWSIRAKLLFLGSACLCKAALTVFWLNIPYSSAGDAYDADAELVPA